MKKTILSLLTAVIIATGFTSCSNNTASSLSDADKEMIIKVAKDINDAFSTNNDTRAYVNAYYAKDATILYPNTEAVKGREGIVKVISDQSNDLNATSEILDINGKDDLAYVFGTVKRSDKAGVVIDYINYIEIWKKQHDGKWQVIYDIYNTRVPVATDEKL